MASSFFTNVSTLGSNEQVGKTANGTARVFFKGSNPELSNLKPSTERGKRRAARNVGKTYSKY